MGLDDTLVWYQKKIGAYDKDVCGKSLEQRILRGVSAIPKKSAKIKAELIDIDLVRGSTFKKSKPQNSWLALATNGIVRVLLFPLYFTWWKTQTSGGISIFLLILYVLQLVAIYLHSIQDESYVSENTITEVLTPIAMMLVLGIMHAQVVATYSTNGQISTVRRPKPGRQKRVKRKTRTRVLYEGKSSPGTASEEKTESQWSEINAQRVTTAHSGNDAKRTKTKEDLLGSLRHAVQGCINSSLHDSTHHNSRHESPKRQHTSKKNSDEESGLESLGNHNGTEELFAVQDISTKLPSSPKSCQQVPSNDQVRKSSPCLADEKSLPSSEDDEFFVARKNSLRDQRPFWKANPFSSTAEPGSHLSELSQPQGLLYCVLKESQDKEIQRRRSSPPDLPPSTSTVRSRRTRVARFTPPPSLRLLRQESNSSCESDKDTTSPNTPIKPPASDSEWPLLSNTDCNGYTSSSEGIEEDGPDDCEENPANDNAGAFAGTQAGLDKVSCTIWEHGECKKVDLSVMDIASAIIYKVDCMKHSSEYILLGFILTCVTSSLPLLFRLQSSSALDGVVLDADALVISLPREVRRLPEVLHDALYQSHWSSSILPLISLLGQFCFGTVFFFLLSVAERTFKQRFLYAKYFCHLTSARRALRSDLPHFRLNKVRNIKTWLSVRSYLKKHGPQRSVDVIVSTAFIIGVCILSLLCVHWLKENEQFAERLYSWEMVCWSMALGIFLMRFMILGSKINNKYRNLSVLITEQINLYLHMEQKPHKKEELILANNVLKLAADLLKELESPFKISGLCANPYLYNITKVVCLSAFSAALTELFGFKLKLHKIKIK
ncbi:protein PHTF1-like isoform X2 [Ornithodoros turicata]|uniref:protein PHTF1-like isoform X2 n=1 Tax=Ornithodoros turicata TaxID=34597 RepID=UPI0031392535